MLLLLLLLTGLARSVEPAWRWVSTDHGLRSEHVSALAQGPDGALWIGTHAGIYRYDGVRAARRDGGAIGTEVQRLVPGRDGEIYARTATGFAFRIAGREISPVVDAQGSLAAVRDLADSGGAIVALVPTASGAAVSRVDGVRLGHAPLVEVPADARVLRPDGAGGFVVGAGDAWYRAYADGRVARVADAEIAMDAAAGTDGGFWAIEVGRVGARVRRFADDGAETYSRRVEARGVSVAVRDGVAWASFVGALLRVDEATGATTTWGIERGVQTGGPLLVDAEGSLWLGTFRGLGQLADPDAALFDRRDGLVGDSSRFLTEVEGRLWVSSWGGLSALDLATQRARPVEGPLVKGPTCAAGDGAVYAVGTDGFEGTARIVRFGDEIATWPLPAGSHFESGCAPRDDGDVWIAAADGLWRAGPSGPPSRVAPWPHPDLGGVGKAVAVDPHGDPWVVGGHRVCALRAGAWACTSAPGSLPLTGIAFTAAGAPWIVRMGEGVLWLREGAWVPIPAGEQLSSRFVIGLRPAVDGGLWVLGHGIVARVQPTDDRAGFAVREELAPWVGHLVSGAADLVERPDGGLWIAHNGGLTHVPASSRRPAFKPPPVHLTELRVAGADAAVDRGAVRVPDSEAPVSLRFSAATYKAPALLRYRVRLDDGGWGESRPDGAVDLRGLDVGVHRVEVAASLDGARWTDPPAAVTLVVPPPWYGRWEVWFAALLAAVGSLVGAERLRAAAALRVERLRTSIALDLHDQVGAGLGAIGLLGGLLQRPDLPGGARGEAARRISATAEELSSALRGIVWSLRADTGNIEALGLLLAERARALLPGVHAAGGLRVSVSDEREPVDVEVLRAAQLIGLEALHNAARHAGASSVGLRVERAGGATWRLVVEDDGVGICAAGAESGAVDRGNGLASMAARAASVGATLRIDAPPVGGTAVVLTFRARRRWWERSMAPLDRGRDTA